MSTRQYADIPENPMTPGEVAQMFGVDVKTVTRWANHGVLNRDAWFWTPGGHRRYHRQYMLDIRNGGAK